MTDHTPSAAQPIFYDRQPDPDIHKADPTNRRQRPFVVDRAEYPFASH